jgi:hypothetical protein
VSALLRVLAALIGTLFAAGLAVLAALLLLLLAVTIRLRLLLILLVGGVSHFPSPFARAKHNHAASEKPTAAADVPQLVVLSPRRGRCAMDALERGGKLRL